MKKYSWNKKINPCLHKKLKMPTRIIGRILFELPGKKSFTADEVSTAYSKVFKKKSSAYSNMLSKLNKCGIKSG